MLLEFLERFSTLHGSQLEMVTSDIAGFRVTPSMASLAPTRKTLEFPLILSQAVDPQAEESSCRDLAALIESSLADGFSCHAGCAPQLGLDDAAAAASALLASVRGGPPIDGRPDPAGQVSRSFGLLGFRVAYRHLQEEVSHPTFVFDLETLEPAWPIASLLGPELPWREVGSEIDGTTRQALHQVQALAEAELQRRAKFRLAEISAWLDEEDRARQATMDSYFDELARELEEERRSVYYHLYFFEKEREIEEKIKRIQDERRRRKGPKGPTIRPQGSIELTRAGVFQVPFARVAVNGSGLLIDLLRGEIGLLDGRWVGDALASDEPNG